MPYLPDIQVDAMSDDPQDKIESIVKQVNEQARLISNENTTKIIKSDSGIETLTIGKIAEGGNGILIKDSNDVNRALFGEFPDGSIALKVSQTGIDVLTAANDDLVFNSSQNILKVVQSGTATVTAIANQGTFNTVNHSLGYTPMVIATCKSPLFPGNNRAMVPYISSPDTTSKVVATVSNTREDLIQFGVELGSAATGSAGDWEFKYFLLQESAV